MSIKFKLIGLIIVLSSLFIYRVRVETFPHILYRAIIEYKKDKIKFTKTTLNRLGGDFSDVKLLSNFNTPETYVLIIGESTTRSHMQLYNYYRNTNPELNKIKNDLIVFNDVISPHTHTIPSLEKVLTLASHEAPNKKYDGTIIQLFNKAGFKTYWLSNQKPMGVNETTATIISRNCNEQIFVNTTNKSLDDKVLKPFEKILKQPNAKKFIIVHLMGSHTVYSERYPIAFKKFKTKPITKFKNENAYHTINTYDNANVYNDFIVSSIIKALNKTNSKSYALYLSDHGEDVYETINMACHTEKNGTKPMFDIPFMLWRSEKFKTDETKFTYNVSRKYSSEDLIYTLSDLSSIHFKEFEPSKSIVNKKFVPKKRLILNTIDYDIFFNKK